MSLALYFITKRGQGERGAKILEIVLADVLYDSIHTQEVFRMILYKTAFKMVKKTNNFSSCIVLGADHTTEYEEQLPPTYCNETTYNFTWGWMVFVYVMVVPLICFLGCIFCGVGVACLGLAEDDD